MQTNSAEKQPSLLQLIGWLTSITGSVHAPLAASTVLRILTQSLDIAMFALAGWTIASALTSVLPLGGIIGILVLALLRALTHYLEQFTGHYVAFKALEILRGYAFSKLWPKAPGITLQQHSGALLTNLTHDVDRIEVVYAHTFAPLVSAFVVPALALGLAGSIFGFSIIAVPLFCVLVSVLVIPLLGFKKSVAATEATLATRADLAAQISDSVHGITEVLVYGRQEDRALGMQERDDAVLASSLPAARTKGLRRAANLLLNLISVLGVIFFTLQGSLEPVWAVTLTLAATRLFEGPKGIESAVGYLDYSFSAARRLWGLCHAPQLIRDGSQELVLDSAPSIEWADASYRYPTAPADSAPALNKVNILAEAGQHTVLVGSSGSGKSTAIQMLLRFDELAGGQILINGRPITDYSADSLRRSVVLVSQQSQVLTGSISENLRLGAPQASDDQLWRVLDAVHLSDEILEMPDTVETQVGTGGAELSGGQLQRLALARALLMQPKVLVLDEFTASLNTDLEAKIRASLAEIYPDLTLIEVTHRLDHLDGRQAVYRFERGSAVRDNG